MKIIIFDLDNTLVNTSSCQAYMTTKLGRERIPALIDSGEVITTLYDSGIVDYFNELQEEALVLVLSDSPKNYCISVLRSHGFEINEQYVFGGVAKPLVDMDSIIKKIEQFNDSLYEYESILVIGDSAKDIYFSHNINSPSIFATWGCLFDKETIKRWSKPTCVATSLVELRDHVSSYLNNALQYIAHDFSENFITMSDFDEIYKIPEEHIGFSKRYIPIAHECIRQEDKNVSFNIKFTVKKAKNCSFDELNNNIHQQYYKHDGTFGNSWGFKSLAGVYISEFYQWASNIGLEGNTVLIPVPSSLPMECNRSFPVYQLCRWWSEWINKKTDLPYFTDYLYLVERWWPVTPSHLMKGIRQVEPHLSSLGIFDHPDAYIPGSVKNIIIIDDVVTSGSQMSAVATLIKSLNYVSDNVNIYGYALAKTTHPNPNENSTIEEILSELDQAIADE